MQLSSKTRPFVRWYDAYMSTREGATIDGIQTGWRRGPLWRWIGVGKQPRLELCGFGWGAEGDGDGDGGWMQDTALCCGRVVCT